MWSDNDNNMFITKTLLQTAVKDATLFYDKNKKRESLIPAEMASWGNFLLANKA